MKSWEKWVFWIVIILLIISLFFISFNACQAIELGADGLPTGESTTTYVSIFKYLAEGGVCPQ